MEHLSFELRFDPTEEHAWNEQDHPRGPDGRFLDVPSDEDIWMEDNQRMSEALDRGDLEAVYGDPEYLEFWHGTTNQAIEGIRKEGLVPGKGKGGDAYAKEKNYVAADYVVGDRAVSVYMSTEIKEAQMYAVFATKVAGGTPVVLKIRIPKGEYETKLKEDELSKEPEGLAEFTGGKPITAARFEGRIPPEWITNLSPRSKHAADDGKTVYAVVIVKDRRRREQHGEWREEDHPRDDAGRFSDGGGGGADASSGDVGGDSDVESPIMSEPTAPPRSMSAPVWDANPHLDSDRDGVADAARVGVRYDEVPPPPQVGRLPNLTSDERDVEDSFAEDFERDPDGMADQYLEKLRNGEVGDAPNIFNTDDAKVLSGGYNPQGVSPDDLLDARSRYNVAVHGTANAIAKRAFLKYLDEEVSKLPPERRSVLITSGGVAAGKGYAIGKVGEVNEIAQNVGAIWDAAGEQNATENPWVLAECQKRGIKTVFAFVDADPEQTWENPERGVVERAGKKGRMVDARVFADSYVHGARNFNAFYEKEKGNPNAQFIFLENRGKPRLLSEFPKKALALNAEALYERSVKYLLGAKDVKPAVRRGGSVGLRIWGPPKRARSSHAAEPHGEHGEPGGHRRPEGEAAFQRDAGHEDHRRAAAVLRRLAEEVERHGWDEGAHPRDDAGRFTDGGGGGAGGGHSEASEPSQAWVDSVRPEMRKIAGKGGLSRAQDDAAFALGYPARGLDQPTMAMAERVERASTRMDMLEAIGSQASWHSSPSDSLSEWDAAQRLGAVAPPKEVGERVAGQEAEGSYARPYVPMGDSRVAAFAERQRAHQEFWRSNHGDGDVTVYRGIHGKQAKAVQKYLEGGGDPEAISLAVHGLSSWSLDSTDANDFAGPKGVVLKTTISARDVWFGSKLGSRGVIRFVEDAEEVITINKEPSRKVSLHARGTKAMKRSKGLF